MAGGAGNEPRMQKATGEDGSEFFTSRCGEGAGKNRAEPSAEETVLGAERRLLVLTQIWDCTGAQDIHPSAGTGRAGSSQPCPALSLGSPFPRAPPNATGLKHSRGVLGSGTRAAAGLGEELLFTGKTLGGTAAARAGSSYLFRQKFLVWWGWESAS